MINRLWELFQEVIRDMLYNVIEVTKKTIVLFIVVGFALVMIMSAVIALIGWYFTTIQDGISAFVVFCVCIAILIHVTEIK